MQVDTVDFPYLVTSLKSGNLKLPSIIVQAGVPVKRKFTSRSLMDSFFNDFDRLKHIALATEEVDLEVKPPINGMNPWLPAKSLTIEEIFPDLCHFL